MARRIRIRVSSIESVAQLNETKTAQAIWEKLPIKGRVNLWGEEVYFSIPLNLELEAGQEFVNIGDLGYWAQGKAFCIFFGPTPISRGGRIHPASPVAVFGKVIGDATVFKHVTAGAEITVEKEENEYNG